jgi:hypothetical protein
MVGDNFFANRVNAKSKAHRGEEEAEDGEHPLVMLRRIGMVA